MINDDDIYLYYCVIRRIVDGDTIEIDIDLGFDSWILKERVRLSNIDCPEVRTSDPIEKEFGILAMNRVRELIPEGQRFVLISESYHRRDGFGRVIGDFILENGNRLGRQLIDEYHGVEWQPNDRSLMKQLHLENREYLMNSERVSVEFKENIQRLINEQSDN